VKLSSNISMTRRHSTSSQRKSTTQASQSLEVRTDWISIDSWEWFIIVWTSWSAANKARFSWTDTSCSFDT